MSPTRVRLLAFGQWLLGACEMTWLLIKRR